MMLISPNKKRQAVTSSASHSKKKGARTAIVAFNDEANVIERTESYKMLAGECINEVHEQRKEKEAHVHSRKYRENLIKMI